MNDRQARAAVVIGRAMFAFNLPFFYAVSDRTLEGPIDYDAEWEAIGQENRIDFIYAGAQLAAAMIDEGYLPVEQEWGVEERMKWTAGWGPARIESYKDRESAVEAFREAELRDPLSEHARLVSRGVTEWMQVIDDGIE